MLRVQCVNKTVAEFRLKDISFELEKGYINGLIGRNGAGKSTLLKILLGMLKPDSGSIEILGKDLGENEKWVKDQLGFVLAENLFEEYNTIEGNALVYGRFYSRYDHKTFLEYCEKFELDPQRQLRKTSRGEKMKFQYAFALAHDPRLLILDEPLGSFDPEFAEEFSKSLSNFIASGENSVILATHITSGLDKIGDYITYIDSGRILFSKDKETLTDEYKIVTAEDYKINLIPRENIIYKEVGKNISKALVKPVHLIYRDPEFQVDVPNIEELMYFMDKGNYRGE